MTAENRIAILCVHGIQGNPRLFHWIESTLSSRYTIKSLTLPGHGKDVSAFRKSTMAQWQQCVDTAIRELSIDHDSILYIGHSMGCLLGIDACVRRVGKIQAMVLLACPLALRPTLRYLRNNFCAVTGRRPDDVFVSAAREANGVSAKSPLAYLSCVRPYCQLLSKMRTVRPLVPRLHLPVTAFHSELDEIVSAKSLDFFRALPHATCRIVPGSGHYLYTPAARNMILAAIHARLDQF